MPTHPKTLHAGLVQHACTGNRDETLARTEAGIRQAAGQGAQLIVLQELHTSLYFCQHESTELFDLAETIPGPSTECLGGLAAELGVVIVGSLFERRAPGLYHNTAVVLERDGRLVGTYRKMHIPDDPGYYEKFYFTPGDLGFEPIDTSVGRLGVLGPVVPGSRAADGPGRCRAADLPHRHWLEPGRYGRRAGPPARCVDHHSAVARRGQRPAGAGLQPGRP